MGHLNKIPEKGVCVDGDELPLLGDLLPFVCDGYGRNGGGWFCSGQRVRTNEPMPGSGRDH